jgi:hypothetical protein
MNMMFSLFYSIYIILLYSLIRGEVFNFLRVWLEKTTRITPSRLEMQVLQMSLVISFPSPPFFVSIFIVSTTTADSCERKSRKLIGNIEIDSYY